jgi:hypothetical protein
MYVCVQVQIWQNCCIKTWKVLTVGSSEKSNKTGRKWQWNKPKSHRHYKHDNHKSHRHTRIFKQDNDKTWQRLSAVKNTPITNIALSARLRQSTVWTEFVKKCCSLSSCSYAGCTSASNSPVQQSSPTVSNRGQVRRGGGGRTRVNYEATWHTLTNTISSLLAPRVEQLSTVSCHDDSKK